MKVEMRKEDRAKLEALVDALQVAACRPGPGFASLAKARAELLAEVSRLASGA
jgi:hypothetical protein